MSGWWDSIFGNLPPMPSRPTSRGSTFGAAYQGMPSSANIEDRRTANNVFPSRPHDQIHRMMVNPFGQTYNMDQWDFLQRNMPQLAALKAPTTPLPDPSLSLDPSIMAQQRAMSPLKRMLYQDYPGGVMPPLPPSQGGPPNGGPDLPTPMPNAGQSGPQFGTTLNSFPWWANAMGAT
jgi:hypothetical protein